MRAKKIPHIQRTHKYHQQRTCLFLCCSGSEFVAYPTRKYGQTFVAFGHILAILWSRQHVKPYNWLWSLLMVDFWYCNRIIVVEAIRQLWKLILDIKKYSTFWMKNIFREIRYKFHKCIEGIKKRYLLLFLIVFPCSSISIFPWLWSIFKFVKPKRDRIFSLGSSSNMRYWHCNSVQTNTL